MNRIVTLFCPFILAAILSSAIAAPATESANSQDGLPRIVSHMRSLNQALRQFRAQFENASLKTANLKLVDSMIENAKAARNLEPLKTPEIPVEQRSDFLKGYQAGMDETIKALMALRDLVDKGHTAEIGPALIKLNEMKQTGHEKYQKEEE